MGLLRNQSAARQRLRLTVAVVALVSCGGGRPGALRSPSPTAPLPSDRPPPPSASPVATAASPAPPAPALPSSAPAPPASPPLPSAHTEQRRTPAVPGPDEVPLASIATPIDDPDAWRAARHLSEKSLPCATGCSALSLAGLPGDGVASTTVYIDEGGGADELTLYLVRGQAVHPVFTTLVAVHDAPDDVGMVDRVTSVSVFVRAGVDLVVVPDGDSCAAPPRAPANKHDARIATLCRSVGRHAWNGARFVRGAPAAR